MVTLAISQDYILGENLSVYNGIFSKHTEIPQEKYKIH